MLRSLQRRKATRAFKRNLWDRITDISSVRSANSAPTADAGIHIEYLHSILDRYERLLETEEGRKLDLKTGVSIDLPYLRFALDRLTRYHQRAGVDEIGRENARIYVFFVQVRLMEVADVAGHLLHEDI